MRYLEINTAGRIVNIIEWDGVSPYAPEGITLVPHAEHPETAIGWTLIDGTWTAPQPVETDDNVHPAD